MSSSHPFASPLAQSQSFHYSGHQSSAPTGAATPRPRLAHMTSAPELRAVEFRSFRIAPQRLHDTQKASLDVVPRTSTGRYVKQAEKLSIILEDQDPARTLPIYVQEGKVDGLVSIASTNGVVNVTVKIRGVIDTRDFAGLGKTVEVLFDDVIARWDVSDAEPCPSTLAFQRHLPSHYTDERTGKPNALPPSYHSQLPGLPGYKVAIKYSVLVEMREKNSMWKRASILECPFLYRPRTRPRRGRPFPPNFSKTVADPVTLFVGQAQCPGSSNVIHTQLYLPTSQIFCMENVIPFHVKLSARDAALDPFASFPPPSGSFLPECSTSSLSPTVKAFQSSSFLPPCLRIEQDRQIQRNGSMIQRGHISLELVRTTAVDTMRYDAENYGERQLLKTVIMGETVLMPPMRGPGYISWSGELRVSKYVECGGFTASNVHVSDALIFRVTPPGSTSNTRMRQIIPVHLTTDCSEKNMNKPSWSNLKILELY